MVEVFEHLLDTAAGKAFRRKVREQFAVSDVHELQTVGT